MLTIDQSEVDKEWEELEQLRRGYQLVIAENQRVAEAARVSQSLCIGRLRRRLFYLVATDTQCNRKSENCYEGTASCLMVWSRLSYCGPSYQGCLGLFILFCRLFWSHYYRICLIRAYAVISKWPSNGVLSPV